MKPEYTVSEIRPRIFFLKFKRRYDLCMQFLRYQEFYESPNPNFRDHAFDLIEFMEWYALSFGDGCFSYPTDWSGFNLPGNTIKRVWDLGVYDRTKYDYDMLDLYRQFAGQYPDGKFYIIGSTDNGKTMRHEVAHAFFYVNDKYNDEMSSMVSGLDKRVLRSAYKLFKKVGYAEKVYADECQAYFATGLCKAFSKDVFKFDKDGGTKPFVKIFNRYFKA